MREDKTSRFGGIVVNGLISAWGNMLGFSEGAKELRDLMERVLEICHASL